MSAEQATYLGVDPGLNRTGYAVLRRSTRGPVICEGGVIRSTRALSLAERVHEIGSGLRDVIAQYEPAAVAVEQVFSLPKNPKTAVLMSHARGAILYAATDADVPVTHYAATRVKQLMTGSGRATKLQVQQAVSRELGLDHLLEPNDVADAFAIALCHYHVCKVADAA